MIVDLFAGGGGASTGILAALGRHPDVALNHSWDALRNHALNHPTTRHVVDDIRSAVPLVLTRGAPVELLWASPDCRHFSRAKGGKPCHPEVRSLPWEIVRWARQTRPATIAMENVPEMLTWGPLVDQHADDCSCTARDGSVCESEACPCAPGCPYNRPDPEQAGTTWNAWVDAFKALGYRIAWWKLDAADYGAPTHRRRLIIVARLGADPVCPPPTHGPGRALPWRTAAECIDWSDVGESIFDDRGATRHAPATLRRIATGVMRFVVGTARPFLVQTGYGERAGQAPRVMSVDAPLGTVVAGGAKHALVSAFLAKHYGGVVGHDVRRPLGTVTTIDHHSLVSAQLAPARDAGRGARLVAAFISTYYGQSVGQPVDAPLATQTTRDRHALVTVEIEGESYAIVDIRMRMLKPDELARAQGFPADYRLDGTARLRVKLIGNSVPPPLAAAVVKANTNVAPTGARRTA